MPYFRLLDHKIYVENYNNQFLLLKEESQLPSSLLGRLGQYIFDAHFPFIKEVISTEVEICLQLDKSFKKSDIIHLINMAQAKIKSNTISKSAKTYNLPICFNNDTDWRLIEEHTQLNRESYISQLLNIKFELAMYGFLPGFLYLTGLPSKLHCPRKAVPSKVVAPNSLAVGAQYLGLYSLPSPAGWNIIGSSPFSINNIPNLPPNLLRIGDKIKLISIEKEELTELYNSNQNILTYND